MKVLPVKANENGREFTVADFFEAGKSRLQLSLVVGGESMKRKIEEPIINRPGLALAGFFGHFAWKRPQLIGNGEIAYLKSLSPKVRESRLKALVDSRAFCFIYTSGHSPSAKEIAFWKKSGAVVMTTPLATRVIANRGAFVLEKLAAPSTTIYGTMVEVAGIGVLFEGAPSLGKSETALGLIKRGSALIADDLTCIRKDVSSNLLFGSAAEATAGYMEIRGIGIMHVPSLFGVCAVRGEKRLQMIITFRHLDEVRGEIDRIGQTRKVKTVLGVDVPNIVIPVSEGRDLVNLVETAAMQQKLLMCGRDPVIELSEHLRLRAEQMEKKNETKKGDKNG